MIPGIERSLEPRLRPQDRIAARHLGVSGSAIVAEREPHPRTLAHQPDPRIGIEAPCGHLRLNDRLDRAFGGSDHAPMLLRSLSVA